MLAETSSVFGVHSLTSVTFLCVERVECSSPKEIVPLMRRDVHVNQLLCQELNVAYRTEQNLNMLCTLGATAPQHSG